MELIDPGVPSELVPEGSRSVVVAKDHPVWRPMPTVQTPGGRVITRWTFTDEERQAIAAGEDLFMTVITSPGRGINPVRVQVGMDNAGWLWEREEDRDAIERITEAAAGGASRGDQAG
jgi:hypothetical protein